MPPSTSGVGVYGVILLPHACPPKVGCPKPGLPNVGVVDQAPRDISKQKVNNDRIRQKKHSRKLKCENK